MWDRLSGTISKIPENVWDSEKAYLNIALSLTTLLNIFLSKARKLTPLISYSYIKRGYSEINVYIKTQFHVIIIFLGPKPCYNGENCGTENGTIDIKICSNYVGH